MKKIDPIERALDAYFELDTDQKEVFDTLMRIAKKQADRIYGGRPTEPLTPRRGRPAGSKNRKMPKSLADLPLRQEFNSLAPETFEPAALFAQNGAVTEDL